MLGVLAQGSDTDFGARFPARATTAARARGSPGSRRDREPISGPRGLKEVKFWSLKAAEQWDVASQYRLGFIYEFGCGVTKNLERAAFWYRKAAAQKNVEAVVRLGRMGIGP